MKTVSRVADEERILQRTNLSENTNNFQLCEGNLHLTSICVHFDSKFAVCNDGLGGEGIKRDDVPSGRMIK